MDCFVEKTTWGWLLGLLALLLVGCSSPSPTATPLGPAVMPATETAPSSPLAGMSPSIVVADQELVQGRVTIAEVVSQGPGWIVVYAQADGEPGRVLGYSPVAGIAADIEVPLDRLGTTERLYAVLHTDVGQAGVYEYPGDDVPVRVEGETVTMPFSLKLAHGETQVEMSGSRFEPDDLAVRPGTTVTWVNQDDRDHTVTADEGAWDSGLIPPGESFAYTFEQPGIYLYHCALHGGPGGEGMAGSISVVPAEENQ